MKIRTNWALWIFPITAILICGWLFYDTYRERGPTIKIIFPDASGLQVQKTQIRFRGVPIGYVNSIEISDDRKKAIVSVHLQKNAETFAVEGSQFWIVSPKVSFAGVSGLETILEGTYIGAQPGPPENNEKLEFNASITSEYPDSTENTSVYILESSNIESVGVGDPVTFRGLVIGSVSRVSLNKTAQMALIQISISNNYSKLIRTNTIFWRKVGIQADLGLFGSKVKINSLESVMKGGIELSTPDPADKKAKYATHFPLNPAAPKNYEKWNTAIEQ